MTEKDYSDSPALNVILATIPKSKHDSGAYLVNGSPEKCEVSLYRQINKQVGLSGKKLDAVKPEWLSTVPQMEGPHVLGSQAT